MWSDVRQVFNLPHINSSYAMESLIQYRTMQSDDIEAGFRLCHAAGWNQVRRDWELFLRLSPDGCFVAVQDAQIVATVTTVRYQERFGWIGMMLVDAALRRQGIGRQLMLAALQALGEETCARLDATPAGYPLYRQLGFVEEYALSRMECAAPLPGLMSDAQPMQESDLAEICPWDQTVFGADRRKVLAGLLAAAPELCWVVRAAGRLHGYVLGRCGARFIHLGPVVAMDEATAQQLVAACVHEPAAMPFVLDVRQQQTNWLRWLTTLGFAEQRPLIRMHRGPLHFPGEIETQFAILGPEFG